MATGAMIVARKSSENRRFGHVVRMDADLCEKARKLAALRGQSMAEMFSEVLRPWVDKEWAKEVRKLKESDSPER